MVYDPKRRPWENLAVVEPREFSGLDRVFSLRPVFEMLGQILSDERVSLREVFGVSWPPEFSTVQLLHEDTLIQRLFRDMHFWVQNGSLVSRIWYSHKD